MQNKITGRVYVLGDDIDTDQIIPAAHLVYSLEDPEERKKYGEYALSGVPTAQAGLPEGNIPFVKNGEHESEYAIIIAAKNFGCGSSREHAPAALEIAGVEAVIAPTYARIFYRNAVDGGFLIPAESQQSLVPFFHTGDEAVLDLDAKTVTNKRTGEFYPINDLGQVSNIIDAGGIFSYARKSGMLKETADA